MTEAKWQKVPPAAIERFDACLPEVPGVQRRQMFGCPCVFVNGNMFAGLHEHRLILRLPQNARERLYVEGTAAPFVVMGRTMREYVAVEDAASRPQEQVGAWLMEAFNFAARLPPKAPRAKPARKVNTPAS